jgi:hypothetical protein
MRYKEELSGLTLPLYSAVLTRIRRWRDGDLPYLLSEVWR